MTLANCRYIFALLSFVFILLFGIYATNGSAASPAVSLLLSDSNKIKLVKKFSGNTFTFFTPPVIFDNKMWFSGIDAEHGMELWHSDGTALGTKMVADINPGSLDSRPAFFKVFNNELFFIAFDGTNGYELRKTFWNSTLGDYQTVLVKDIYPGADSGFGFTIASSTLVEFRGSLFFAADDGITGKEIWMTDGTNAGTVRVTDLNPGADGSNPKYLTVIDTTINNPSSILGEILVFAATYLTIGEELWRLAWISNSYSANLVRNINTTNNTGSSPLPLNFGGYGFFPFNGALYFKATDATNGQELWKTSGTFIDTSLVRDINPAGDAFASSLSATIFNNELFFSASDGGNSDMWKTDGTTVGTVKAYASASTLSGIVFPNFVFNNDLYFTSISSTTATDATATFLKRYWDSTTMSWQAMEIGNIYPLSGFFDYYNVDIFTSSKVFFSGQDRTNTAASEYGIYKLSENTVSKFNRGYSVKDDELTMVGLTLFNDWVYLFGQDHASNTLFLKFKPE